jgi:hypothetical protein
MIEQVTNEFASGKRDLSTNIIIEDPQNNMASVKSYLIVTEKNSRSCNFWNL